MDADASFRELADTLDELVFVATPPGEMLWVNQAFERETGLKLGDFGFRDEENPFVHPQDLALVVQRLREFGASEEPVSAPICNRFFDSWGQVRSIRTRLRKVRWEGRPALLFVGTLTDAARAPVAAERGFRALVDAADDGILRLDSQGVVLFSNRRQLELSGRRAPFAPGTPLVELFESRDGGEVEAALSQVSHGATPHFRAQLAGTTRFAEVTLAPIDEPGAERALLAVVRDVTEVRLLERQALRREKEAALGTLVSGIAHDLNNIVTGVLANATYVQALPGVDPGIHQALEDIRVAGQRAAQMGRAMLTYLGQGTSAFSLVQLDELVRETLRLVRPLLGATVEVDAAALRAAAAVRADESQLGQVVMNLLVNAAQAMSDSGGRLTISSRLVQLDTPHEGLLPGPPPPGLYAVLTVRDTGAGMTPEVVQRIFDPSFTTKPSGHGLGLSTTLGIVTRHQGAMQVESSPGRGSAFEVYLPVGPRSESSARLQPAARRLHEGVTVLVVDDEAPIRALVRRILEKAGAKVLLAADGQEALRLAGAHPVRVALLDARLKGERGTDVARALRQVHPQLPVLFSSGHTDEALEDSAFLPKPYTSGELLDAVAALLG